MSEQSENQAEDRGVAPSRIDIIRRGATRPLDPTPQELIEHYRGVARDGGNLLIKQFPVTRCAAVNTEPDYDIEHPCHNAAEVEVREVGDWGLVHPVRLCRFHAHGLIMGDGIIG